MSLLRRRAIFSVIQAIARFVILSFVTKILLFLITLLVINHVVHVSEIVQNRHHLRTAIWFTISNWLLTCRH